MLTDERRPLRHMQLTLPVIVLVAAFTAIPIELRPVSHERLAATLALELDVVDEVANIVGYVPVGIALASRGALPAVGIAAGVSLFAETTQLFTKGRSPSLIDVATNVIGAIIGLVISARWKTRWKIASPQILIDRRRATLAIALALGYVTLGAWVTPLRVEETVTRFLAAPRVAWLSVNPRGATSPGRLEAHWKFDGSVKEMTLDASGNGLDGVLIHGPTFVDGVDGRALRLNGVNQYADFGDSVALRLTGSMTISAWINPGFFPLDDAVIVSDHSGLGYQLDTTVDRGPRTIGFKLADASGRLMARYGRTPLEANRWYYVAGVYDARAQTLNVYLNGQADNGCLLGTVSDRQHISGVNVFVGRRGGEEGFEFAGSIDDVRIYSRALTQGEIETDMKGAAMAQSVPLLATEPANGSVLDPGYCENTVSDSADARACGLIVGFGVLAAFACAGFWPTPSYRMPCVVLSFAAGFLLLPAVASTLPAHFRCIIPVLTLVGGASVAASVRRS